MYNTKIFLPKGVKCSFVINRKLKCTDEMAREEEQAERILYFIPSDTPLVDQVKYANIADAMIEFSSSFDDDSYVNTVKTDSCTYYFSRWEPDTWFVMVLYRSQYRSRTGAELNSSFSPDIVLSVMNSIYNIYTMFYDPIEPLLYKETEDHKIIISELISTKTAIHKLQYEEDCAQNGYIAASAGSTDDRQSAISALQSRVESLESQSAAPQIRQSIHRIMRKCLIYENWEQLHCLYAIDGFLPLSVEKPVAAEIFTLMNQVGEQFASLRYACFLFDGYFVWSDIAMENLNLLRHFHLTNQDQTQNEQQKGFLMIDTEGSPVTTLSLRVPNDVGELQRESFRLLRYVVPLFPRLRSAARPDHAAFAVRRAFRGVGGPLEHVPQRFFEGVRAALLPSEPDAGGEPEAPVEFDGMRDAECGRRTITCCFSMRTRRRRCRRTSTCRGRTALSPISPAAMLEAIPACMAFPMDSVYAKLKNAKSFVETVERVRELDWIYGCVQNQDMLFVLVNTTSRTTIRDVVNNVHRIVAEQFRSSFTLL
ncbi:uncharacterized protein [Blastocystis hominis]|uniref:CCZ1/INTU/HSP4 first Longin domain-containing protein n=1 Tax=Blastocystis hominis TaxID=12968 RepID=D8M639_BLAHO|nr:uncharacterized protein [Blastocystis hominis]CBK23748.2 unnamed protein product [Blastocystis hominis]|eukprot:XP_012897796.1 uncharacterized protein [Blastocystis hominis]